MRHLNLLVLTRRSESVQSEQHVRSRPTESGSLFLVFDGHVRAFDETKPSLIIFVKTSPVARSVVIRPRRGGAKKTSCHLRRRLHICARAARLGRETCKFAHRRHDPGGSEIMQAHQCSKLSAAPLLIACLLSAIHRDMRATQRAKCRNGTYHGTQNE